MLISARAIRELASAWKNKTRSSFSAYGEDLIVFAWLEAAGVSPAEATYLDVGAAHPQRLSNTFLLYRHGAKGVLVEPDPEQAAFLQAQRPRDTVLNAGVAFDERRQADLIRLSTRLFNTFHEDQAGKVVSASENWRPDQRQCVKDRVRVELIPINDIMQEHFSEARLDFLSIDVEAKDFDVLQSLDIARWKPRLICIEASAPESTVSPYLSPFGYSLVARTPDNLVYLS